MKDMYMVEYKVKGVKNLDQVVSLSFYKKTISMPINTQEYNVKGIYGMNGSGKSGIVTSVDILRNLLINEDYLNNPMVQKDLDETINKKTKELYIAVDYFLNRAGSLYLYRYEVELKKNLVGKYHINTERLSYKRANSKKEDLDILIEIKDGEIVSTYLDNKDTFINTLIKKTTNLLSTATISSLFVGKLLAIETVKEKNKKNKFLFFSLLGLFIFGSKIYVYMDQSDNHTDFLLNNMLKNIVDTDDQESLHDVLVRNAFEKDRPPLNAVSIGANLILKEKYVEFENTVERLQRFICIFKSDLTRIDIDRKEDGDFYVCSLNMVYGEYSVNTEFESTGIKKLIRLFFYLEIMAQGDIVFIDEFDSNLHDVYLCALLEYLMEYGQGQLCFTTHNVGPMDILKKNRKSIDFLSIDHKIYPWKKNGNYVPSKLYKNGMIEGSPFNIESIDFIGVLDSM